MIRNGPLKISKSLKKAENGPFGKNLFPITEDAHIGLVLIVFTRSKCEAGSHGWNGYHNSVIIFSQQHVAQG